MSSCASLDRVRTRRSVKLSSIVKCSPWGGRGRSIQPSERMSENRYASKVGMIAHDETMVRMVETIANRIVTRSRGRRARPWAISRVTSSCYLGNSARSLATSARHRQLTRELRRDRSGFRTRAGQGAGSRSRLQRAQRSRRGAPRLTLCRSGRVSAPPFATQPYATQPYATALCTASPSCGSVWAQRPANTTGAGPGAWRAGTLKCNGACASDAGGGGASTGSGVRGCAAAGAAAADGAAGLGGRSA